MSQFQGSVLYPDSQAYLNVSSAVLGSVMHPLLGNLRSIQGA
jgi:hypothetical protein